MVTVRTVNRIQYNNVYLYYIDSFNAPSRLSRRTHCAAALSTMEKHTDPRRAAITIGINYEKCPSNMRLNGCFNDSDNVADYLNKTREYAREKILQLKDPKKSEILQAMRALASLSRTKEGLEEAFVHYSGHGSQLPDHSGNEIDRKDEVIIPVDYAYKGYIRDDLLHEILRSFDPRTRVICLMDCCHSGTACDLPFKYTLPNGPFGDILEQCDEVIEEASPTDIIALSGCRDEQVSMGAFNVTGDREYSGAMSSCLLHVLSSNEVIRQQEKQGGNEAGSKLEEIFRSLHQELCSRGYKQRPVLTSNKRLNFENARF